jgi:hypothetical protein
VRLIKDIFKPKSPGKHPERRVGFAPVPDGIEHLLTEAQGAWLRNSIHHKWSLAFVRSEGLLQPQIVVIDDVDNSYGILSDDGVVYCDSHLKVRTYGLFAND